MNIKIISGKKKVDLDVKCLENITAEEIVKKLPIESKAHTWGDEIYFETDIFAPRTNGTLNVDIGDVAYWPEGKCICIFFGKTPVSTGNKPVPASEVVIIGKIEADIDVLRKVKDGAKIVVEESQG